jgi:hypothetical protein
MSRTQSTRRQLIGGTLAAAAVALLELRRARAQVGTEDDNHDGYLEVGEVVTVNFGDSVLDRNGIRMAARLPGLAGGQIVGRSTVNIDPANGCCRSWQIALGRLTNGSTYEVIQEKIKSGIQANDDTSNDLKSTAGVPCVDGTYASLILIKNIAGNFTVDRSENVTISCH